jgi:hypothetical protein
MMFYLICNFFQKFKKNNKRIKNISHSYDSFTASQKHACHVPLRILLENTKSSSSITDIEDISPCHKTKIGHELLLAHTTLLSSALHNIVVTKKCSIFL